MSFAPENMAVLARANGFALLRYDTTDEAHQLVDPCYFEVAAGMLRRGDLIFASRVIADTRKTSLLLVTEVGNGKVHVDLLDTAGLDTAGSATLAGLADVTAESPNDGQVLTFRNGAWVNQDSFDAKDLMPPDIGAIAEGEKGQPHGVATLGADGLVNASQLRAAAIANLEDVIAASPSVNDVLKYDGRNWIASPDTGAVGDAFAAAHAGAGNAAHMLATATTAGFMSPTDKSKLDALKVGATVHVSGSEIKAAYEAEPDTNAFTDAEKTKLSRLAPNGAVVFGEEAGTACEGNDIRIPDATEQSFLHTVSKSGNNFTITPPNDGGIAINTSPPSRGFGLVVYSGGTRPTQPTNDALVFFGGPSNEKTDNLYVLGLQPQRVRGELVVLKNYNGDMIARSRTDVTGGLFTQYYHYDHTSADTLSTRQEVFACKIYRNSVYWVFGGKDSDTVPNNVATFVGDVTVKGNLTVTGTLTITDGKNTTVYGPNGIVAKGSV
jgi:hypothetical protein